VNTNYKRSIATCFIFGSLFFFLILYFMIIGPVEFQNGSVHVAISSVVIFIAMTGFVIMRLLTNRKELLFDERDQLIQKQASMIGLSITAMFVFVFSIALFSAYRNLGVIEVSWLWLIAYSTFAFTYFITSLITVYLYKTNE